MELNLISFNAFQNADSILNAVSVKDEYKLQNLQLLKKQLFTYYINSHNDKKYGKYRFQLFIIESF